MNLSAAAVTVACQGLLILVGWIVLADEQVTQDAGAVELIAKFDTVSEWWLNASTCYHKELRMGWKDKAWKGPRRLREEQEDE